MKISKILLFMVSVLAGLALICFFMPSDGIPLGSKRLDFPSLAEVLNVSESTDSVVEKISPEQLMAQRLEALQGARVEEFRAFCRSNDARIHLPGDDEAYLDPLFEAMDSARFRQMRIMHYGDSQLECDRISGDLREHFQAQFGGHGVGLVPALQTVATYSLSQVSSGVERYINYGSSEFRRPSSRRYGMMAQVGVVNGNASFTFAPRSASKYPHAFPVTSVSVWASGSGSMSLRADTLRLTLRADSMVGSVRRYTACIPTGAHRLSLSMSGQFDVYGILLDDTIGVAIDNVPMRGCSGTLFTGIERSTLEAFYQGENVRLIILQYGGNSVPSARTASSISSYMKSLRAQIRLFREIAPKSCILFIGPADMATRSGGQLQTYPHLPQFVDSLRQMSLSEGIAFWDMFAAMGGKGSIIRWNQHSPQLAGSDYIHFTPRGAAEISDIFYQTLQFYYRFYRMRTGKERESLRREIEHADSSVFTTPNTSEP